MSCHVSQFPAIDQYLQMSQGHPDMYSDYARTSSYISSNSLNIKSEDAFMDSESYNKMLVPMLPMSYQNVDNVQDSNYLGEHTTELLDLDDLKTDILPEFNQSSTPIESYNTDPRNWCESDVNRWVLVQLGKYGISLDTIYWNALNGLELCLCSWDDLMSYFCDSTAAEIIYSELKKIKTEFQILDYLPNYEYTNYNHQNNSISTPKGEIFYAIKDYLKQTSPSTEQYSPKFSSDSSDSLSSVSVSPPPIEADNKIIYDNSEPKIIRHKQNIHLWQFLKELLHEAEKHNNCIRWVNRIEGIFKIEDSAHVAKLWGLRKKRPAMNYDKLSRSLRQYYKKGIIKKTLASKRLVYQFGSNYL